jgi:hypothetical protein
MLQHLALQPVTAIEIYNDRLSVTVSNLTSFYPDTFDFHTLFYSILDNPAAYPETAR